MSPQPLERVELAPGRGFPCDRAFGLARADSGFDPAHPAPLPKTRFFMLQRDERLAGLQTWLDPKTEHFTIRIKGRLAHECDLSDPAGVAATLSFFATMFGLDPAHRPIFARGDPHRFTDVSVSSPRMMNAVSLINLFSVKDLARRVGTAVDPLRFRGNIYFDGWPAWRELELVDEEIRIGEVRLRILKRTSRCAATEVNPATARRDLPVPRMLMTHYGHADMGVYAEVLSAGSITAGDPIACA